MNFSSQWPLIPIGEVANNKDSNRVPLKQAERAARQGKYPYYGASGIIDYVDEYLFEGPHLLIGEDGANLLARSSPIAFMATGKFWVNNHAHVLGATDKIDLKYLKYYFATLDLKPYVTGSAQPKLNRKNLDRIPIPLPPIEEQRRIAAILDKADGLRRKRKEAIALTEELLRSAFLDMFGDPVTNPKGWKVSQLGDFGEVITGNTPPRSEPDNYGNEIEWIKSDNITTPEHFLTEAEERLSSKGGKKARIVPAGSVLVTCIAGSKSSIGRAAIADREVAFNQQINAVVPASDVDPYFLYSHFFIAQHLVQAKSTDSMKGLVNKSKFSSVDFIKPPKEKQQEFGQWFLRFFKYYENLTHGEQTSSDFFNSLLQRAFRGEL